MTVDEEVLVAVERLGIVNLSAAVNNALIAEVDAAGHRQALGDLLSFWDEKYGEVPGRPISKWLERPLRNLMA